MQQQDVLIVGAGPVGLTLANALAQAGFRATVLELQEGAALAQPAPDGREIALTHPSRALLQQLGQWPLLAAHEVGLLRQAQVHDGPVGVHAPMHLHAGGTGLDNLGWIVPNHALRRTAWALAQTQPAIRLLTGARVTAVQISRTQATLHYSQDGCTATPLQAPLLVAADSRFSAVRQMLGVGADRLDFGRSVIVCRMQHAQPHHEVTHECFDWDSTLAILPLPDDPRSGAHLCSAVVTARSDQAQALQTLAPQAYAERVAAQFQQRLGAMQLIGQRYSYPLVATWAERFAGLRWALVGDAAVGTHPVTAHGFNMGLSGVQTLVATLVQARQRGLDIGDARSLARYDRAHRLHAWPLYAGTNAIVRLYTDARPLPRLLRRAVLTGSEHLPPLKAAIVSQLTGRAPAWPKAVLPSL